MMHNNMSLHVYHKGLSLIEVLITFLLLAIALVAHAKFQITTLQENSLAKSRTIAINLAQNKLEALRNFTDHASFQTIASGADSIGPPQSNASTILTGLNAVYTRTWSVSGGTTPDNIQTEVTVSWPDKDGVANANTIITLSSNISNLSPANTGRLF